MIKRSARPAWQDHLSFIETTLSKQETAAWSELFSRSSGYSGELRANSLRFRAGQFEMERQQCRILDFDDASSYWHAANVAFALRDIWNDDPAQIDFGDERLREFLNGYESACQFDKSLVVALPWFLRFHKLYSFASLLCAVDSNDDSLTAVSVPLRAKLEEAIANYREKLEYRFKGA